MRAIIFGLIGLGLTTGLTLACGSSGESNASNGTKPAAKPEMDASASIDAGPFALSMPCGDSIDSDLPSARCFDGRAR